MILKGGALLAWGLTSPGLQGSFSWSCWQQSGRGQECPRTRPPVWGRKGCTGESPLCLCTKTEWPEKQGRLLDIAFVASIDCEHTWVMACGSISLEQVSTVWSTVTTRPFMSNVWHCKERQSSWNDKMIFTENTPAQVWETEWLDSWDFERRQAETHQWQPAGAMQTVPFCFGGMSWIINNYQALPFGQFGKLI